MIIRRSPTAPAAKTSATEARPLPELGWTATPESADDAEWERSLFLQPARLAEARRCETAPSGRWSGLLLAGLAALAVGVGEVRAEDGVDPASEESTITFDYWAWLASWFADSADSEYGVQQKNGEGTSDPGEGD